MTFEDALAKLRLRHHVRRAEWRASIGWPPGIELPVMFWPSGFVETWRPTLEDVMASDWVGAT